MQKLLSVIVLIILGFSTLIAQTDTVFNQTDNKGQKQGYWKKNFQNGNLMYKGFFKNNKPLGEMHRFYEDGQLQAILFFNEDGNTSKVKLYYQDGEISAEGFYYGTLKDSIWKYYSFYSGKIVSEEHYSKGKKNGISKSFYESGVISEEIEYHQDIKDGIWNQFFEDGKAKLIAFYKQNMVNGKYIFNYPNGKMMMLGSFIDNKRNGVWSFFNDDSTEKYQLHYEMGIINAEDEKKLVEQDKEFFQKVDESVGKFEEPTPEDFYKGPQ